MTITSTCFGRPISWNESKKRWEPQGTTGDGCPKCGRKPTPEGYDPCLGHIPGAVAACCGHGAANPTVTFPDVDTLKRVCVGDAS